MSVYQYIRIPVQNPLRAVSMQGVSRLLQSLLLYAGEPRILALRERPSQENGPKYAQHVALYDVAKTRKLMPDA
jgi:hypothetical protein